MHVHDAATADLDAATLYRILALRSDVFVVEQDCAYLDLDGRDLEPDARQLWIEGAGPMTGAATGAVTATVRLLVEPDGAARIGRLATRRDARGAGLAARLMARALELGGERAFVLNAQAPLHGWYERFGFLRDGDDFLDDGIPHIPMRRAAGGPL